MTDKTGFLGAYSPWSSRSTTPKSAEAANEKQRSKEEGDAATKASSNAAEQAFITHYKLSSRDYPKDCPKLNARWFYATDALKRKAQYTNVVDGSKGPLPEPKKYSAFSSRDSNAIENAFQELVEREAQQKDELQSSHQRSKSLVEDGSEGSRRVAGDRITAATRDDSVKVPVNEDFLFDVDIQKRELGPAYWLGPVYDVRRGSWFKQEGQTLKPVEENLAAQLEQGYIKIKPWLLTTKSQSREPSPAAKTRQVPQAATEDDIAGTPSEEQEQQSDDKNVKDEQAASKKLDMQTQRLFGRHSNSVVTYTDASTAYVLTDDFYDRMSSTVWQRFAGGGYLGGAKVFRGYRDLGKSKDGKKTDDAAKRRSDVPEEKKPEEKASEVEDNPSMRKLERQMSSLDTTQQEAEAQQEYEKEIRESYVQAEGEDQGREIEHLVLVTHGIGQKLGLRLEMLNFIADVNMLRKTVKNVYKSSPDLQMLNSEVETPRNSRIQVLPVVWRHQLNFPDQSFKKNKERDLADSGEEEEYPSLENITLEPATIIRTAIRDLGLDILMYQSAYREHISETVVSECNRVYKTFKERNPDFKGKISLIGHSLGSAIMFDVLCQQKHDGSTSRSRSSSVRKPSISKNAVTFQLDFDVEDYYCLGSPLGLYQMLNGRRIMGRPPSPSENRPFSPTSEAFGSSISNETIAIHADGSSLSKSAPKCAQLFNIFHPADPIAYRLEPLISTAMASMKPQPLPYTKKGIFDVQGQGLSAISNRVGQSVSGLWSSVTGGMAASLLNRTLGMQHEASQGSAKSGSTMQIKPRADSKNDEEDLQLPPTLIDGELETLYAGFEKSRRLQQSDDSRDLGESSQWNEAEQRSKKLKREEAKVRALNTNGRVDFAIQT